MAIRGSDLHIGVDQSLHSPKKQKLPNTTKPAARTGVGGNHSTPAVTPRSLKTRAAVDGRGDVPICRRLLLHLIIIVQDPSISPKHWQQPNRKMDDPTSQARNGEYSET